MSIFGSYIDQSVSALKTNLSMATYICVLSFGLCLGALQGLGLVPRTPPPSPPLAEIGVPGVDLSHGMSTNAVVQEIAILRVRKPPSCVFRQLASFGFECNRC